MRVGIVGGGQLARMLALAARPLGIDVTVLEPTPSPPAASVATVIAAPFDDPAGLAQLADTCDVITVELEAVPVASLQWLNQHRPVHPSPQFVAVTQDRLIEKEALRDAGIVTAPFGPDTPLPAVVKTRFGGYDGRGQQRATTIDELTAAINALPDPIVEGIVTFHRELSIIAAADAKGELRYWPVATNEHRHGILHMSTPRLDDPRQHEAEALARRIIETHHIVGVMCIELFDTDGGLVANEMAPRVHNSGHWTIDGSTTSQFEQHIRAICALPLGDSDLRQPCATINVIGAEPPLDELLAIDGVHVHRYEKPARPSRKLGHVTVTAPNDWLLNERVQRVVTVISPP
jgi:5-(carboxyamino)imidazole ribonucleotide synthase